MLRLTMINIAVALIYLGLFAAQASAMSESLFWASLVFLPHGWRIVCFFLFRFSALPGLFAGHLATCLIYFGDPTDLPLYVVTSLQGTLVLPFFYVVLKWLGKDLLATRPEYPVVPWTSFATLAMAATILNGVLVAAATASYQNSAINWTQVSQYLVGDFFGAVIFIGGLIAFFRWQRQRQSGASPSH